MSQEASQIFPGTIAEFFKKKTKKQKTILPKKEIKGKDSLKIYKKYIQELTHGNSRNQK